MTANTATELALLKARLNAARLSAEEAQKTIAGRKEFLPFLESCAREMEQTAQLIRAVADQVAGNPSIGHKA